jgi:hypothetical protein
VQVQDKKVEKGEAEEKAPAVKQPRTLGLRLFDIGLYPILTNFGVFVISVVATYLTSHGADHGKIGAWFQRRGDWMMKKFKKMGMSHNQADMSKMVFFSFADGTVLAPMVKLFEDRREKIAKRIDEYLGTVPKDLSVYDAEPKQSWASVIGGRLATAAIVVPTAVALDKTGLNTTLFKHPGEKIGKWVASKPRLAKHFGGLHIPALFGIGIFEAFYTSVCTTGLYFSSRLFARWGEEKKHASEAQAAAPVTTSQSTAAPEQKITSHAAREAARQHTAATTTLTSLAF